MRDRSDLSGVLISCSVKLHAFQLAEQLDRHLLLKRFFTSYHATKNSFIGQFNNRRDTERIDLEKISTFPWMAPLMKIRKNPFANNGLFDALVCSRMKKEEDYSVFIGWSGMSIQCIREARKRGKKVVVERGSSHIQYQFELLEEEFARWGYRFKGDNRVAAQELEEYELADYISIPSKFVHQTFIDKNVSAEKLIVNNYGVNSHFTQTKSKRNKFTILYVGNLSIRKGIPYLWSALHSLPIDPKKFEVWFVGSMQPEIREMLPKYTRSNWKFFGHINHHELPDIISQCSLAVHPSLEEGLSMVIPQLMGCGVPVIATTNTGGQDIIEDGVNGFIVPIRSPEAIAEKIAWCYEHPDETKIMCDRAEVFGRTAGSWNQYGDRYAGFIRRISGRL